MEEQIRQAIREKAISEMKKPTILMNSIDLEKLVKSLRAKYDFPKIINDYRFEDIPIITRDYIERGRVFVFDDIESGFYPKNTFESR